MSASNGMQQSFNPPGTEGAADQYRLSQAMRVGDMIWVSGQVGVTPDRTVPDGIEAQTRLTFENLKTVLESAGATLDDVVELTLLLTDTSIDLEPFYRVKDEYIRPPYPAITGFGVSSLALPGLLLEVRAVAVAGSAANR
ncbi:RidA family protein [Sphingopyxis indica]|uniref:RidA family protein n=1 Tax=Sphingopyxis indica TaxID=436663 RepID=UPI002938E5BE|nr:RidA family protein [Sphingopyxis indica]WOF42517.1 RidA family protein [Sphingopyxis indica]